MKMFYVEGCCILLDCVLVGYLGVNERKLVFEDSKLDWWFYEIVIFVYLWDWLYLCDVWVEGSWLFWLIDEDFMLKLIFVVLKDKD